MRNKTYDQTLKKKYDKIGKILSIPIMRDVLRSEHITDNLKEDSGDFTDGYWDQKYRFPSGKEIKTESETKDKKWWNNDLFWLEYPLFDYETMDIPYRKNKNDAQLHIVISTCRNFAFLVSRYAMDKAIAENGGKPKIKETIHEPDGAPYFSTPVCYGKFVYRCKNGPWRWWKKQT
jgi:hypothetical protein